MKKLCFLLFCFGVDNAVAQQVVVVNMKENIVYCGVNNPLSALVEGHTCTSVVLTTNNGKITKTDCGGFIYQPAQPGMVKIKVWIKKGKILKKVGEVPYRVKQSPLPVAFLGPLSILGPYFGGTITVSSLIRSRGVRALLKNSDYDVSFQVTSYSVSATHNSEKLFRVNNTSAQYNDTTLSYLEDLQIGDQLLISNIICKGPDGKELILQPLEFTIIE